MVLQLLRCRRREGDRGLAAELACLAALATFFGLCAAAPADTILDEFDKAHLDETIWNPCQFEPGHADFLPSGQPMHLALRADDTLGNVNDDCKRAKEGVAKEGEVERGGTARWSADGFEPVDDPQADFGPRLPGVALGKGLQPFLKSDRPGNQGLGCHEGDKDLVQRTELRLQDALQTHVFNEDHWYSIRFRVRGDIPDCGSVRFVLGQWKFKTARDWDLPYHQSPTFAQRLDNGVLHLTVQNDRCRCMVSSAPGDPHLTAYARAWASGEAAPALRTVPPGTFSCVLTGEPKGTPERACTPDNLQVLTTDGRPPEPLPDPRKGFVAMTYRVRGGADGSGRIDVYANGRFIARIQGVIGYREVDPLQVKFKFGIYRDLVPGDMAVDIDSICTASKAHDCVPDLRLIDDM
jgi:hypothetical protein